MPKSISSDEGIEIPKSSKSLSIFKKPFSQKAQQPAKSPLTIPQPSEKSRLMPMFSMPQERPAAPAVPRTDAALFIKIDKYSSVVQNVGQLKVYANNMRDTLDELDNLHRNLQEKLDAAHKLLDRFNGIIASLDSQLGHAFGGKSEAKQEKIDDYVKSLYDQMQEIKTGLKSI